MPTFQISTTRVASLVEAWASRRASEQTPAASCGALVALFGDMTPNTLENQRGQAVIQYLLNADAPVSNVAVLLTQGEVLVVHTSEHSITTPAATISVAGGAADFNITVFNSLDAAKSALSAAGSSSATVGCALKELAIQEGPFAQGFIAHLRSACVTSEDKLVESAIFLGELLFVKDADAQLSISKAAVLCSTVFRRYVRKVLESESARAQPSTLYELRERLCERLANPALVEGLEGLPKASEYALAGGLTACIFHQGTYVESIQVPQDVLETTTKAPLRSDVVVVRYGTKNKGNTAFLARTLIFEAAAPAEAKDAYKFVYDVSEKIISLLVPGAVLADVYTEAKAYAESLNPTLAAHLGKNFGFSTGLLVLEARGTISEKATATRVADGMGFVVRVCLEKVPVAGGDDTRTFDVELADTVVIHNGAAEVKTKVSRKLEEVVYVAPDEDEGEADEEGAFERRNRDLAKITRQGQSDTVLMSAEAARDEQLKVLLRELHAELIAAGGKKGTATSSEELRHYEVGQLAYGELHPLSTEDLQRVPEAAKRGIYVQTEKKVLWLPVCGKAVPFHLSTVSKADVKMHGDQWQLTVFFHTLQEANAGYKLNRTKTFVKELTYTSNRDVFSEVQGAIQGQIQRIKNEDALRKRNATSAGSAKLRLAMPASMLRLPQVKVRPVVSTGRQNRAGEGNLELHENGLRFSLLGATPIDIVFDNIKHIIFQPAVSSISVIYHITLKKSIEVGRKPTTEIQFVADVMESSEAATGTRRTYEEELAAEERDIERIKAVNAQFMRFAHSVEQRSKIRTQLPVSHFSFDGVHTRSMTVFRGSRQVLWAVSEWPAFTQSVEEIELVSLERVVATGSTFDMSLVFKDYNRPVQLIASIPREHLSAVKDWCLNARLYYTESSVNPNWRTTLKEVRDDPEWDPWAPGEGWSLLNHDGGDDEEGEGDGDSDDSDSTYYEEEDEEDDTSDDDSSWMEDEESDVANSSDDDDDESAVSWDEMERRAEQMDRRHGRSDDDDDRPRKKSRTTTTAASAGGRTGRPAGAVPPSALPRPGTTPSKMPMAYGKSAVPPARRF